MRIISFTRSFKRDYRREKSDNHAKILDRLLHPVFEMLAHDEVLTVNLVDHPLNGEWADCRDCHVKPDLVLIYRKPDNNTLELVRLGSHSQLVL